MRAASVVSAIALLLWTSMALGQTGEPRPYVSKGWTQQVAASLQQFSRFPTGATNDKYARATVSVTVRRDGNVTTATIKETSGYPELDKEALSLIYRSQPFPRFPSGMHQATHEMQVPIGFQPTRGPSSQRVQDQPIERERAAAAEKTLRDADNAAKAEQAAARDRENAAKADEALREAVKAAEEKGTAYANESGMQWRIDSKNDEMTDRTNVVVSSRQTNDRGAVVEVEGSCFKPGVVLFTALIVDERGRPTINLPTYSNAERTLFGTLRINADEATPMMFAANQFRNKFAALALVQSRPKTKPAAPPAQTASGDEKSKAAIESIVMMATIGLNPQPLETTWRALVEVETTAGKVLIKLPLFDKSVRTMVDDCRVP